MTKKDYKFSVNIDGPIAVYVQIENLIKYAIAAGRYEPGDTLPSVRDMSEMLGINPNTVTKSYRDLELLRLVHTRRGVGVTVSQEAPKLCRNEACEMAKAHLRDGVAECLACGLTAQEMRKVLTEVIEKGDMPYQPY